MITSNKWIEDNINEVINGELSKPYIIITDNLEVTIGNQNDCNLNYCNEKNIPVYNVSRHSGTIVFCNGTLGAYLVTNASDGWVTKRFTDSFKDYLSSKGLNVTIDHNDILVDGFKVASSGEYRVRENLDRIYSGYLISYDIDLEAINHICEKPMVKTPKGLKEFGIEKDDLINWLTDYFNNI